jgi:hypothetical protein
LGGAGNLRCAECVLEVIDSDAGAVAGTLCFAISFDAATRLSLALEMLRT